MTNPQDSDLSAGAAGVPTPNVSEAANAQPSSQGTSAEDALVEKALAKLAPQIEKIVQSTKDKRLKDVDDVKQYIPTMQRVKAYLDAAGGDPQKAAREMAIDDLLTGQGNGSNGNAAPPEPTAQLTPFQKATAQLLAEAGIANTDPEVAELAKANYKSEAAWFRALAKLAERRSGASDSPPSPALNDSRGLTPANKEDEAKKLDKIPFGDSRPLYEMAAQQIRKGRR